MIIKFFEQLLIYDLNGEAKDIMCYFGPIVTEYDQIIRVID